MVTAHTQGKVLDRAEHSPFVDIRYLTRGAPVLVLAPHPDDESLGCGAAIAAASAQGTDVFVACLTDGAASHPGSALFPPDRLALLRTSELTEAVGILSAGRARILAFDLPDGGATIALAATKGVQAALNGLIKSHAVRAIWTTWEKDPHIDHGCAAQIGRALQDQNPTVGLFRFPVWGRFSSDDLEPTDKLYKFDSGPYQQTKRRAVAAHRTQMSELISDDESGFRMDAVTQEHFISSPELFIGSETT